MKKSKSSKFFEREVDKTTQQFVAKSLDITVQVLDYLKELGWTKKEFALKLGKTEAELSKWFSADYNFTIKNITQMEVVLNRNIIITPGEVKRELEKINED